MWEFVKIDIMSSLAERIFQFERSGYRAIQIRIEPASDVRRRYVCRAANQPEAAEIASRLIGAAANVRGFTLSWIQEDIVGCHAAPLPVLAGKGAVSDPLEWAELLAMSVRSQSAAQAGQRR